MNIESGVFGWVFDHKKDSKRKLEELSTRINSLSTQIIRTKEFDKAINNFTSVLFPINNDQEYARFEYAFVTMLNETFTFLNHAYDAVKNREKLHQFQRSIKSIYDLIQEVKNSKLCILKDYVTKYPEKRDLLNELEARLAMNKKSCGFNVFVEDNFMATLGEICAQHSKRTGEPSELCIAVNELKSAKVKIDTIDSIDFQIYDEYFEVWRKFRGLVFDLVSKNYINLYSTNIVHCLFKYMEQQTQMVVSFREQREMARKRHFMRSKRTLVL